MLFGICNSSELLRNQNSPQRAYWNRCQFIYQSIVATNSILFWLFLLGSNRRLHTAHKETQLVFIDRTKANWHTATYFHLESKRRDRWWLIKGFGRRLKTYLKKRVACAGHKFHIYLQASHLAWSFILSPISMLGHKRPICSPTALVNCNFVSF